MAHDPQHAGAQLTLQAVTPQTDAGVIVTSEDVPVDGRLSPIHSAEGDNRSPALSWNAIDNAESYALVVEDPDAPRDLPFVHWLLWDIPGSVTSLPQGVEAGPRPASLAGAAQGHNDAGTQGWYGMKPPKGHGAHHYHFQVFALSKTLGMSPTTALPELLGALKSATLASGELVGTFETPDPMDAPSPAHTGSYGSAAPA